MLESMDAGQAEGDVQVKAKSNDNAAAIKIEGDQEQTDSKMTDSDALTALNEQLRNMLRITAVCSPKIVERNVKALKKIQWEHLKLEVDFHKELYELEMKYEKILEPLYERRRQIVNGTIIPTDEECDFQSDSEKEIDLIGEMQKVDAEEKTEESKLGIPGFWLTVLKNAAIVTDWIERYDEPILMHLIDIKVTSSNDPMISCLEFHFEPNKYFSNSILTLSFEYQCTLPDSLQGFGFRGPKITGCKGCTIDWKEGRNVTTRAIKTAAHDGSVIKIIRNESFFNLFCPPTVPEDKEQEVDEDARDIIKDIYNIGNFLKDQVIGYALLFFNDNKRVYNEYDDEEEDEDDMYEEFEDNFCDEDVERKR